jgi:signal transduction histidine kinase/CheY-like chemotaxis protein
MRLAACIFIALAASRLVAGAWPLLWLGVTGALQLASLAITEPARRDRSFRMSPARSRLFRATVSLNAAVFASLGALLWFAGGEGGRLCSLLVLAGGAINVMTQARGAPRVLWLAQAPFILTLGGLPLVSFLTERGPQREVMGLIGFCALLFVMHLALAGQRSVGSARVIRRALSDAEAARRRAETADRAKSDFLAVMSHELRTPLNGVLGMAQIMESDELADRQLRRLEVVKQSGEALLGLVNDLLDAACIEDQTLELEAGLVDLDQLRAEAEAAFGPVAYAKGLGLRINILESAGTVRAGDPARVRQVLHKLLDNAVKFTESGRVGVLIEGSPGELVIEVTDSGVGIAPERLEVIFDRFSLADGSVSRQHGGAGLGLSITRGLVRLMGGELTVRSEVDRGSVFTARLRLPLVQATRPAAPPQGVAEAHGERSIRILAAEDNPTNQMVLKALLEQLGAAVQLVGNGQEAVAAWRAGCWDLVLMDIQMPTMDGVTAARAIRSLEAAEGRPRTPIIAVTANASAEQAAQYVEAGMDGLVPKPIHFAQLLAAISGAIAAANENIARDPPPEGEVVRRTGGG